MRICVVTAYPPWRGSLSEFGKALTDELAKLAEVEEIHIIANVCDGLEGVEGKGKIVLHRCWRMNSLWGPLKAFREILRVKPSLVYFNVHLAVFSAGRMVNFLWSLLPLTLKLLGFRLVTTLHNLFERINLREAKFKDCLLNRIGLTIATKFYAFSDAVVVTMRSYVDLLRRRYGAKAFYIPHGAWLFSGGNADPGSHILYLGYIGPYKDVELLLEAFRLLRAERPGVRLLFSGSVHPSYVEAGLLERLKREEGVSYLGYVPDEELGRVVREACIIALPYATCTGTSGVLHLLASFGRPFLTTELPEFLELKREGAGILTAKRDPEDFFRAMRRLLEDKQLYIELGGRNVEFARSREWGKVAQEYLKLFRKVVYG